MINIQLRNKMLLIISFNARPIANLARKLGLEIAIVDFWGDKDLFPLSENVFTVFKPANKSYRAFPDPRENEDKLIDLALDVISREDIDSVLIGSGLDDRPDLWARINAAAPVLGITPKCLTRARDLRIIQTNLGRKSISFPSTVWATHFSPIRDFAKKVGFPLVIKPEKTLGGIGIQFIRDFSELEEFCEKNMKNLNNFYFQEYVQGKNISTTLVGDEDTFNILSINEQLIGLESSGTRMPFKYCGNIVPFDCHSKIAQKIENVSETIARMFKLRGVVGIDFVLENSDPIFMEINPRFPGMIEIMEMVSQMNAVQIHLNALKGILPKKIRDPQGYAMKQVLFAKTTMKVPNLKDFPNIYDVPAPNIVLNPEDPICTIQYSTINRKNLLEQMDVIRKEIYSKFSKEITTQKDILEENL